MSDTTWKPHPRQVDFFQLPDTIFEALYGGSAGGGKSEALLMLMIVRGFYKLPRFKGILFRRTFAQLESEIIQRSALWYPATGATYNASKYRWKWPSGAIMQFGHMETENDVRNYDTAEYNFAAFDELTSFTETQYKYLVFSRVRTSIPGYPTIVRSGTNPGNVGHAWVRKRFIESGPPGVVCREVQTNTSRIFIPCLARDNPHIDKNYIQRMQGLPEAERRAKAEGDWYTFEGQVFEDWREKPGFDEPENANHLVEDFKIPDFWPKVLAVDWGFSAMTYALWGALSPDGRIYLYREYAAIKKKIVEWATEIKLLSQEEIRHVVMCKSGWQNRGEELNLADQFAKISGLTPEKPENNRIAGKLAVQDYLRWKPRPKSVVLASAPFDAHKAMSILRTQGTKAYEDYRLAFEVPEDEKGIPKLQVFKSLSLLRKTIPLCIYDTSDTDGKPSEDVAEFAGDDPYDTLRYLLLRVDKMRSPVKEEKYRQEERAIYGQLEATGDQTTFQRRMALHKAPVSMPIRRFTRAGQP